MAEIKLTLSDRADVEDPHGGTALALELQGTGNIKLHVRACVSVCEGLGECERVSACECVRVIELATKRQVINGSVLLPTTLTHDC